MGICDVIVEGVQYFMSRQNKIDVLTKREYLISWQRGTFDVMAKRTTYCLMSWQKGIYDVMI